MVESPLAYLTSCNNAAVMSLLPMLCRQAQRLPSPVAGTVIEVNPGMDMEPEVINQDPYGEGWLAIIEAADWPADKAKLLDPQAYFNHMVAEAGEEVKNL
jgi:hypothetical protein